ncbi:MAG: RMD1 family protein [Candidatus Kapaibacterium sp.]|nr:MAG: RMD1 family protein [Candidatus Kapabacteria bacterium]
MSHALFGERSTIQARALYLGERIDTRNLEQTNRLALSPLLIPSGELGYLALFRYGVVVMFNIQPLEEVTVLKQLEAFVQQPFERTESESLEMRLGERELVENGNVTTREITVERLQIVADILAKSVVMAHYETTIARAFDAIEPIALAMQQHRFGRDKTATLMQYVGDTLLIQHKMVGRVEITEKPELLWEMPELTRLFGRLEDEYELVERHNSIERKLNLISSTVETELDILQNQRTLRMEWYVVVLIFVEILLSVYDIFFRHKL